MTEDPILPWYRAALAAVEPEAAVRRHLVRDGRAIVVDGDRVAVDGRLVVVAIGKAAVPMASGVAAVCGGLIDGGIAVTKDGHAARDLPAAIRVREAGHPIPDERGLRATREALDLVAALGSGDVVLALISGGGSALFEAPRPPVTLADLAATTDALLRAGAPISDLNAVRVPLSLVKGGGLRRAAAGARFVTLLLSDVLGNDPRVIASGPTVPTTFTAAGARAVLDRYGLRDRVSASVVTALSTATATSAAMRTGNGEDRIIVVGDNAAAVQAAADEAASDGLRVEIAWRDRQGEAADLGRAWCARCAAAPSDIDVLFGGGEATVTVRGDGVGGRNTEFALAAALELARREDLGWRVASLATDGQDALTGVAGTIADAGTVVRAAAKGIDAGAALRANDSLKVFEAAGGIVAPGPTGTNVNDLYVAVRSRRDPAGPSDG